MGPGILLKAIFQGSFSLMVFGWTQIIMDIQPLVVIVTGEGRLHGFTHTYIGATFIAAFSAFTGEYLADRVLLIVRGSAQSVLRISWSVAVVSAFIGSYSHIILDSIMHSDIEPLLPFSESNQLLGVISVSLLYKLCVYSGLLGGILYFIVNYGRPRHSKKIQRMFTRAKSMRG